MAILYSLLRDTNTASSTCTMNAFDAPCNTKQPLSNKDNYLAEGGATWTLTFQG